MPVTRRDVRFGCRMLAKSRGFTAVAVGVLVLAVGANTAIFTVMDTVFRKFRSGNASPFPFPGSSSGKRIAAASR